MRLINNIFKRILDVIIAFTGILVALPMILFVALLIKVFMPGPVFFVQSRVGMNKKMFNIIKFRTMIVDKDAENSNDFSKDKERLTKFGILLRRTKIDEIPQLINVLKGDMSLVGPRPTVLKQVELYSQHQLKRLDVKPGMTGLAQVNGGTKLTWPERIEIDIEYVNKNNIFMDIMIMFKTLYFVFFNYSSKEDRNI